ncbi:MAG: histidine--tRNA ligase [Candidatus Magasanikbacteria bacterium RIFOXYC2_FULL_40_16]|uniref:Histidine--tRNA ligase n=3 Tax=Candidatus Magasanikiibacteriota TaxID=1752731 RepID=A0A1F6NZI0_9BACT|nr:MAG: histidine--tRNA ligase [Candidatus Magasanikbacteria bacterium RIFOXYC2_FULL_40_16]
MQKNLRTISLLRGMKDITPKDELYWRTAYHKAEEMANAYGFEFMETPALEEAVLFTRSLGKDTDVVDKEMYVFEDRDGTRVALRPEWTAGAVRAYINHGMQSLPQPVKVWNYGAIFRHDRPQAGRFRQFHQFGCETIGQRHPCLDAELILVAYNFLKDLGIHANVNINSIGNLEDRQNYTIELVGYLRSKRSYLCENCKKRINKNPLRVLDCKEESCAEVIQESPQIIEWLGEESKTYFMKVLECLDELGIPYILKSTLVRGLDYYCDTVFEFFEDGNEEKSQNALGGGGRYDMLVEQLGGQPTPAAGFALGLERVISILRAKEDNKNLLEKPWSKVFFAQLGDQANYKALKLIEEMRLQGVIVRHNLAKASLKGQMETADKLGATHTLILGQKEVHDGTIIIRDMDSGNQEIVDQNKLIAEIKKTIKTAKPRK